MKHGLWLLPGWTGYRHYTAHSTSTVASFIVERGDGACFILAWTTGVAVDFIRNWSTLLLGLSLH